MSNSLTCAVDMFLFSEFVIWFKFRQYLFIDSSLEYIFFKTKDIFLSDELQTIPYEIPYYTVWLYTVFSITSGEFQIEVYRGSM